MNHRSTAARLVLTSWIALSVGCGRTEIADTLGGQGAAGGDGTGGAAGTGSTGALGGCGPLGQELCNNGVDDDCDGAVDEGCECADGEGHVCYPGPQGTSGVGVCAAGSQTCAGGQFGACVGAIVPASEQCNGADDDCDGEVDEGLGTTVCGVGACQTAVESCANGAPQACVPGQGSPEVCNGVDDDCDGAVDENLGATVCGAGVCQTVVESCSGGAPQACVPGQGGLELCNGINDDCDGALDEGCECADGEAEACYPGAPGTSGVGSCTNGIATCAGGQFGPCVGAIVPASEQCNGADDDCDGEVDEDLGTTACGAGACQTVVESCAGGVPQACVPGTGSPELCNGIDDDCDGVADDLGTIACGEGACAAVVPACSAGSPQMCTPGQPVPETCNGIDDDCDGIADNLGTIACGEGACAVIVPACSAGSPQMCTPGQPAPETCNGEDDDCNGQMDDDNPGGGAPCMTGLLGICAGGVTQCAGGTLGCVQTTFPGVEIPNGLDDDCDGLMDEPAGSILIYRDSPSMAALAASSLGIPYTSKASGAGFASAFDAGGFDVVVIESVAEYLPVAVNTRLVPWISGGGRVVFGYWDLDQSTPLRTALGVTTVSFDAGRSVHDDPSSPSSLFMSPLEVFPSPIGCTDHHIDNGDELSLVGAGFLAARFDSSVGPGAIAVTNGGRTIVNGFLAYLDCSSANADGDANADVVELFVNEILYALSH